MDAREREMLVAIGHVATRSAQLEGTLRSFLDDLVGSDHAHILLAGQSMEWLSAHGILVLKAEAEVMEHRPDHRWGHDYNARLLALIRRVEPLRLERNAVIHGEWSVGCLMDEECKPRRRAGVAQGPIFHFFQSKSRKFAIEHQFTIGDVEALAADLAELNADLIRTATAAKNVYLFGSPEGETP